MKNFSLNLIDNDSRIYFILILLFISNFLDLIGIYMILPIMKQLLNINYSFLPKVFFLNNDIINENLVLFFISIYLFKFSFLILIYWYQNKTIYDIQNKLNLKFLNSRFQNNYADWVGKKSSFFLQLIVNETSNFCTHVLMPLITLISEIFFIAILFVFGIFIFSEKIIYVLIFFIFFCYFYYSIFLKVLVKNLGRQRALNDKKRIAILNEIILNFREIKLYVKEKNFLDRFKLHDRLYSKMIAIIALLGQIPRLLIEILVVFSISLSLLYAKYSQLDLNALIPIASMLLVATLRLMPSFNRIVNSLQQIQYGKASLQILNTFSNNKKLVIKKIDKDKKIFSLKNINLKNVSFSYQKRKILKNVNLKLEIGKIYGIVGESGSGKTTLLNIISGLEKIQAGEIIVNGNKEKIDNDRNWFSNIAYISQDTKLINYSVLNNITFNISSQIINISKIKKILKLAQLDSFIKKNKKGIGTIVGDRGSNVSSGQAQRILIARALFFDRKIIILDEATSALDKKNEVKIFNMIKKLKENRIIIIVSHNSDNINFCDKIYKINNQ